MRQLFSDICHKYFEINYPIIPVCPNSKAPAIKNWSQYSRALPTDKEMNAWERILKRPNK